MPKVSDYELEHYDDDNFQQIQKIKRKRPQKELKHSEKKDHRTEWKKRKKVIKEQFDDFDDE